MYTAFRRVCAVGAVSWDGENSLLVGPIPIFPLVLLPFLASHWSTSRRYYRHIVMLCRCPSVGPLLRQSLFCFFSFVTNWDFEFCHNLNFWVLSQFDFFFIIVPQIVFLSFVTIWILSLVTIWVFEYCHNLCFWVYLQFEFWVFCQKGSDVMFVS